MLSIKIFFLTIIFFYIKADIMHGQEMTDKPDIFCSNQYFLSRIRTESSTLNVNQNKIDIKYYDIDIDIDIENEIINGSVMINGSVGMDQPSHIELDLDNQLVVDSVKLNNETWDFIHDDDLILIPAPVSIPEGYNFSIKVYYGGTPSASGFGSFNFDEHSGIDHIWTLSEPYGARDWWPCKDDPSDKADSIDIKITVPNPQIAVSNGVLKEQLDLSDGRTRYHWSERYPISTYLVSITSYPYIKWEDQYIGLNGDVLPLEYYVYPDHYDMVYDNYLTTKEMMNVFADKFGEYPFMGEKYGHVEFGRGGGMEHQTISSLGGHSQWLIAHELGHQWWGNLITCESFHHIWLNEGFARFSEAIWEEATGGVEAYKYYWDTHTYFGGGTIFVEEPNTTSQIFNPHLSYNKAGWVLHMLRGIMGDEIFFETLKSYGSNDSLSYSSASTKNFQLICEDVSGMDLEFFFQQWIYGEYYPKYSLSWEISDQQELIVTIDQNQTWQYFQMPIDLEIIFPYGTSVLRVDNQGEHQEYNLGTVDAPPYSISLDPNNWILKEVEYLSLKEPIISDMNIQIYPAYPNPFNLETAIEYFIPRDVGLLKPKVNIYDIKGNIVDKLDIIPNQPGGNKLNWNASSQSSGIYFIQFLTENNFHSQKVQLVK